MKKIWFDDVIRSKFLKLVKNGVCPPTEELRKHKGLYSTIVNRYGSLDDYCKKLGINKVRYNHVHFKYNGETQVVRSKGEMYIYIILSENNIDFKMEVNIAGTKNRCDFYLPITNTHIEFWGLMGIYSYYDKKMLEKKELYAVNNLDLLSVFNFDISYIYNLLKEELLKRGFFFNVNFDICKRKIENTEYYFLNKKYNDGKYFQEYLKIHNDGLKLKKDIKQNHGDIYNYIRSCYGNYRNFLKIKGLYNINISYDKNIDDKNIDVYNSYLTICKKENSALIAQDLTNKYVWLYGRIKRKFGFFDRFKKEYNIVTRRDSNEDKFISFRNEKKFTKPWRVRVTVNGKTIIVGQYKTKEEARIKRDEFIKEKENGEKEGVAF